MKTMLSSWFFNVRKMVFDHKSPLQIVFGMQGGGRQTHRQTDTHKHTNTRSLKSEKLNMKKLVYLEFHSFHEVSWWTEYNTQNTTSWEAVNPPSFPEIERILQVSQGYRECSKFPRDTGNHPSFLKIQRILQVSWDTWNPPSFLEI